MRAGLPKHYHGFEHLSAALKNVLRVSLKERTCSCLKVYNLNIDKREGEGAERIRYAK